MSIKYKLVIELTCKECKKTVSWTSAFESEDIDKLLYWKSLLLSGTEWIEENNDFKCKACSKPPKDIPRVEKVKIKEKKETRPLLDICPEHKSYKGLRKPRTNCKTCMDIYNENRT